MSLSLSDVFRLTHPSLFLFAPDPPFSIKEGANEKEKNGGSKESRV